MSITVAALIESLQQIPDQTAVVKVQSAGAGTSTNLLTVDDSAAASSTPPSDGPESSNLTPAPGTVNLADV